MWWRPLTPRSSIEAETFLSRNEKRMSLRGGQRPTRPPPVTIRSFQNVGNLDFFRECGLPHHPAGWFAMTCVTWGRSLEPEKKPACRLPRYAGMLICGASEPRQSLPRPDPSGIRRESRPTGGWYLRWRGWCRPWQPEPGRPSLPCRPQNER